MHDRPKFRAPGTATIGEKTFLFSGHGRPPCSATYAHNGETLTFFYADLRTVMSEFAIFQPHNNRLEEIVVPWADFGENNMYDVAAVFLVGPVSRWDSDYLIAANALQCQRR